MVFMDDVGPKVLGPNELEMGMDDILKQAHALRFLINGHDHVNHHGTEALGR